jgi:hypothetical protein
MDHTHKQGGRPPDAATPPCAPEGQDPNPFAYGTGVGGAEGVARPTLGHPASTDPGQYSQPSGLGFLV